MAVSLIRPAEAADLTAIGAIWNQIIRDTSATFTTVEKTKGALEHLLHTTRADGHPFLVAEAGGRIQGFATYGQFRGGPGYRHTMELSVHLHQEARGQGLGRRLLVALEDHARAAGVHVMMAGVSGENAGAIAFHEACGYVLVARLAEVGRKFDRWMDMVLLQKTL